MNDLDRNPPSAEDLILAVRQVDLLDAGHLEELSRHQQSTHCDAATLTHWMRSRGWLTEFQAEQLLSGQADKLVIGSYRLLEPLGEGGMGHVYKARHRRLGRTVALKLIRPELLKVKGEVLRRFQREARAAAQLLHPNVVTLYDADEIGGMHFIAMEYVEGTDLARLVEQRGPLEFAPACDYIRQAALGLQHACDHGLVHRDIKPSNLLLSRKMSSGSALVALSPTGQRIPLNAFGQIKILDLGLARLNQSVNDEMPISELTQQGAVLGTPDYIAPEQARNAQAVDIRADLYSLGCTFYFLLTGSPPFPTGSAVNKLLNHQLDAPRAVEDLRPDTPPAVRDVLLRLMAKRAADRYQTPYEVATALEEVLRSLVAAPPSPRPVARPEAPRAEAPLTPHRLSDNWTWQGGEPSAERTQVHAPVIYSPARRVAILQGHEGCLTALEFSGDGRRLATAGLDQTVRVWDLNGNLQQEEAGFTHPRAEVHALAFAPDRPVLTAGTVAPHGPLWRWDWTKVGTDARVVGQGSAGGIKALTFDVDGRRVAAAGGEGVLLWKVTERGVWKRSGLRGHGTDTAAVAFAPDGRGIASGGSNGVIDLWEVGRFWNRHRNVLAGHHGPVTALTYSPDGAMLVSGGLDQTVRVWDPSGDEAEERQLLSGMISPVRIVRFLAGGQRLIAADDAGHATLWNVSGWSKLREWVVDKTLIARLTLSPDGTSLVTSGTDGVVIVFRLDLP